MGLGPAYPGNGSGEIVGDNLGNHTATENLNMAGFQAKNVADPIDQQDAATKEYVDNNAGVGEVNDGANVGSGAPVFRDKTGTTLNFRTVTGSNGVTIIEDGDEIRIDGTTIPVTENLLFLTGDQVNVSGTNYYLIQPTEGSVASVTESVTVGDGEKDEIAQYHTAGPFSGDSEITAGSRTIQLDWNFTGSAGGDEKLYAELYLGLADGTLVDSGILTNPVSDLGVRPIIYYESAILTGREIGDGYTDILRGELVSNFPISTGDRITIRVLCEKVGTTGGNKTFNINYGSDHESFFVAVGSINIEDIPGLQEELDLRVKMQHTPYVPAQSTVQNTAITDGSWLTISNVDTTDYPFPVRAGNPSWSIQPPPSWSTQNLVGDLAFGLDWIVPGPVFLKGARFWANGNSNEVYLIQFWDITNPNSPNLLESATVSDITQAGWVYFDQEFDFTTWQGARFRVSVIVHSNTNDTNFNDIWTNLDGGAVPTTGVLTVNDSSGLRLFISDTSSPEGTNSDRSADLLLMNVNDSIKLTESADPARFSEYRVTGPAVDQGSYVEVPVQTIDSGFVIRNNQPVSTEWVVQGAATNTDYVEVLGGIPTYFPNGDVQGFVTQVIDDITDPGLVLTNNLYGVDLLVEPLTLSDDFTIMAYSRGSNAGAGDNLGNHVATKNLNMMGFQIKEVAEPTDQQDAATKDYVDTAVANVPGDNLGDHTATTTLNMSSNPITNVVDPVNDQDAATKKYVDDNSGGGGGGDTHSFQFATSSTLSGSPVNLPSAFTAGQLPTGYTTIELVAINGYTRDYSAAAAGDCDISIYTRGVDQAFARGIGTGTLVTTQAMLTTAVPVSTLFDGPLSKDLTSAPIDFSAAAGELIWVDFSDLGNWFLTEPAITLVFRCS